MWHRASLISSASELVVFTLGEREANYISWLQILWRTGGTLLGLQTKRSQAPLHVHGSSCNLWAVSCSCAGNGLSAHTQAALQWQWEMSVSENYHFRLHKLLKTLVMSCCNGARARTITDAECKNKQGHRRLRKTRWHVTWVSPGDTMWQLLGKEVILMAAIITEPQMWWRELLTV